MRGTSSKSGSGGSVVGERVLVPPARHVQTSYQDVIQTYLGSFPSEKTDDFTAVADQLDSLALYDFQLVRRRMKHSFQPFSDAGTGRKTFFHGLSEEEIDSEEASFMLDIFSLLEAAHFRVLSRDDWDAACDNEFTFTNPMEVAWEGMDRTLLQKFWSKKPDVYANAAAISDRVLILNRGVHLAEAKGIFLEDKIDLLVLYLVARPLEGMLNSICRSLLKREWRDVWPKAVVVGASDTGMDLHRLPAEEAGIQQQPKAKDPLLDHENARWVQRVTLKDLMPNAGAVFRNIYKELRIQEPAFNDTVLLYRRKADTKVAEQKDEKKPVVQASADDMRRNIHIKRFQDVPLADMEMIFPDKKVFMKPLLLLQLFFTIIIGIVSVLVTFVTTEGSWSVVLGILSVVATRAYQVYTAATLGRQKVLDQITERLYNQTMDAQDGVIYFLLDQMADQHVKEQMLAYFILLANSEPLTESQLDGKCEDWLKSSCSEAVDFALEKSLPLLLEDGLIKQDAQGRLTAVPIEEGRRILSEKGQHFYRLDKKGHSHLPVFSKLSQKKMKAKPKANMQGDASSQTTSKGDSPDIDYENPSNYSNTDHQQNFEDFPKVSITPPNRSYQRHPHAQGGGAYEGGVMGGTQNMLSSGADKKFE